MRSGGNSLIGRGPTLPTSGLNTLDMTRLIPLPMILELNRQASLSAGGKKNLFIDTGSNFKVLAIPKLSDSVSYNPCIKMHGR